VQRCSCAEQVLLIAQMIVQCAGAEVVQCWVGCWASAKVFVQWAGNSAGEGGTGTGGGTGVAGGAEVVLLLQEQWQCRDGGVETVVQSRWCRGSAEVQRARWCRGRAGARVGQMWCLSSMANILAMLPQCPHLRHFVSQCCCWCFCQCSCCLKWYSDCERVAWVEYVSSCHWRGIIGNLRECWKSYHFLHHHTNCVQLDSWNVEPLVCDRNYLTVLIPIISTLLSPALPVSAFFFNSSL